MAVLRAGAKDSFCLYCYWSDYDFFKRRPFLKDAIDALQWLYDEFLQGRAVRISISLPPRAGKSYLISLFCSWWLGKFPESSVMRNTATARLYRKFSYDVRNIIRSIRFRYVFDVELAHDKKNLEGWNLTTAKQVSYFGAGVGGSIIGFGAGIALTDDLYPSMEHALSETYNDKVQVWKESAHDSRKEKNCPEIFIGTRWTPHDVIGKALEEGKIDRAIRIAALTEDNKSFCEDVKSTAEYLEIKSDIDESIWEAEYMQDPSDKKGKLFPKESLKFYDAQQVDLSDPKWAEHIEYVFIPIDAADTGGDFYAAPAMVLIGERIYIPEVIFSTDGVEATEPETVSLIRRWRAQGAEFEGNGGWVSMGKSIRRTLSEEAPNCSYRIIKNTVNKGTRILAQAGFIRKHICFRSDWETGDPQYRAFMKNLMAYMREGGNKNDDAPDVLAGGAKHFFNRFSNLF